LLIKLLLNLRKGKFLGDQGKSFFGKGGHLAKV
jgi:hypothetical protein